ncbi:MAG: hypothetical protein VB118_05615 [Oscillospiraceae bacterium]|nr:hypothetical protein [Oscillospiraceae bacterium]
MNVNKMTFRQKVENYWYHYKWVTVAGIFVVVFIVVCSVQMAIKKDADVTFMYAGPASVSYQHLDDLKTSCRDVLHDYNGDGSINVNYIEYSIYTDSNGDVLFDNQMNTFEMYRQQLLAGDAQIYLLESTYYDDLLDDDLLVPFVEFMDAAPADSYDAYSYMLGNLDIYKLPGFDQLPADTIICLRSKQTIGISENEAEERYQNALKAYKDIISFKLPETSAQTGTQTETDTGLQTETITGK